MYFISSNQFQINFGKILKTIKPKNCLNIIINSSAI